MAKDKKTINRTLMISVLVIAIIALAIYGRQSFLIVQQGDTVLLPEYSSVWCDKCALPIQKSFEIIDVPAFKEDYRKIVCTDLKSPEGGYIPGGCEVNIEVTSFLGETGAYICPSSVSESKVKTELGKEIGIGDGALIDVCRKIGDSEFESKVARNEILAQNEILYLLTEQDLNIKKEYELFCLWSSSRGLLSSQSSCSQKTLLQEAEVLPLNAPQIFPVGQQNSIKNIIIGYSGFIDNIDIVKDPVTKQSVYLQKILSDIQSCPVKEDKNGKIYVETINCKKDLRFKCLPSLAPTGFSCPDGINLIKTEEGAECKGSGVVSYDIIKDSKCPIMCVNGKQDIGSCEKIIGYEQGVIKPLPPPSEEPTDYTPLFILGIAFLIVIILILVAKQGKK